MRVLKDQWKCKKGNIIFNVQQNRLVYKLGDYYYYFFRPMGLLDLMV